MRLQKLNRIAHQNYSGPAIVPMLNFRSLNDLQKSVSVSMFALDRLNKSDFIFSVEDVYHTVSKEFFRKEFCDLSKSIVLQSIPSKSFFN